MAADMLTAYYSKGCDSAKLFSCMKAEKKKSFYTHLNRHNVIRLDIQQLLETKYDIDTFISRIEAAVVEELLEEYPGCAGFDVGSRLKIALNKIFKQEGQGFIFIIDEWDCVFRLAKNRSEKQKEYLDFLRGLFKGAEYVDLAYMTGILPIKKYGEHSAINIFDEYSMISPKNLGLGYLTYDKNTGEVLIPNQEITQEFMRAVRVGGWDGLIHSLGRSEELLKDTWARFTKLKRRDIRNG